MSIDYQRKRLYDAEDAAFGETKYWKKCQFKTLTQCKEFAKVVVDTRYWKRLCGWRTIKLKNGRVYAYYDGEDRTITLPKWARNELIIIHEMAHYLTDKTQEDSVGHGSHFCGHYLSLVDELFGTDYSMSLVYQFEEHRVKYYLQ